MQKCYCIAPFVEEKRDSNIYLSLMKVKSVSCLVVSDSLQSYGL